MLVLCSDPAHGTAVSLLYDKLQFCILYQGNTKYIYEYFNGTWNAAGCDDSNCQYYSFYPIAEIVCYAKRIKTTSNNCHYFININIKAMNKKRNVLLSILL